MPYLTIVPAWRWCGHGLCHFFAKTGFLNESWTYDLPPTGSAQFHLLAANRLLSENFDRMVADEAFDAGLDALWGAALAGFQRLQFEGFFGTGPARSAVTLLPVGDLPDDLVQEWVSALNPPDVAERFANYAAYAPDGGA